MNEVAKGYKLLLNIPIKREALDRWSPCLLLHKLTRSWVWEYLWKTPGSRFSPAVWDPRASSLLSSSLCYRHANQFQHQPPQSQRSISEARCHVSKTNDLGGSLMCEIFDTLSHGSRVENWALVWKKKKTTHFPAISWDAYTRDIWEVLSIQASFCHHHIVRTEIGVSFHCWTILSLSIVARCLKVFGGGCIILKLLLLIREVMNVIVSYRDVGYD